jgi:uncharacterized cupin superfamily protein
MTFCLDSSAPRAYGASTLMDDLVDWGAQGSSQSSGRVLHRGPEVGLWRCTPGDWELSLEKDEFCYFAQGRCTYTGSQGDVYEVEPGMAIHFRAGWSGKCRVHETIYVTYMSCEGAPGESNPLLRDVLNVPAQADWGSLEGGSRVSGVMLARTPEGRAESGIWVCTPGTWPCHVTSDEFCHFLLGRSTYTHESGEVIEIEPDTAAYFPEGWKGICQVHETIRKVYMIR